VGPRNNSLGAVTEPPGQFGGDMSWPSDKYRNIRWESNYSLGSRSDAAVHCQYCSNLLSVVHSYTLIYMGCCKNPSHWTLLSHKLQNTLQGSVTLRLKCRVIFNDNSTANFLQSLSAKNMKPVSIQQL